MIRRAFLGAVVAALVAVTAHAAIYGGARRSLGVGTLDPVQFLGSDLVAWWDADSRYWASKGGLTDDGGGLISSWRDIVGGYAATGTTTARPTFSPAAFAGSPGLMFDGTANTLTSTDAALMAALPSGATPVEFWVLVQQDLPTTDTTIRLAASYGQSGSTNTKFVGRTGSGNVNRGRGSTGDGAASISRAGTIVDLSSRHVIRWQVGATLSTLTIDGIPEGSVGVVPSGTNTRFRIGAGASTTAANFWQGPIAAVLATQALNDTKAAALQAWLMPRRRL